MVFKLFVLFLAGTFGSALYTDYYSVHEARNAQIESKWTRIGRSDPDIILPMRLGLRQQNLDNGPSWLYEVADPSSDLYGQHWSLERVKNTFKPSSTTISTTVAWLEAVGISAHRLSPGANWISFNASVAKIESLLKTEYYIYEHDETLTTHVACDSYSLPYQLKEHVDLIVPTVHFDVPTTKLERRSDGVFERQIQSPSSFYSEPKKIGKVHEPPAKGPFVNNKAASTSNLQDCDTLTTLECIRHLYRYANPTAASPKNSFGIVQYTPQTHIDSDLDKFFDTYAPRIRQRRPILSSIDGGYIQTSNQSLSLIIESSLDLQYGMSLSNPISVRLYQVGDGVQGATFNNFLDAIDGSYCTYEGGDDPGDAHYPDLAPGGYKGVNACGTEPATKVISSSYSYDEAQLGAFYEQRQCNEYMKLGLMGVTVLFPSGDNGVAGNGGTCLGANNTATAPGKTGNYNPSFPATCPWVTVVGATRVIPGTDITRARTSNTQPEMACNTMIISGGGLSNRFALPQYQSAAVKRWFLNYAPKAQINFGASQYNTSLQSRGYPDLAVNGLNFATALNGGFYKVSGTSGSTPVFAAFIAAINNARLRSGKGSVGFLNAALYRAPGMFLDVTKGSNPGCNAAGFNAVPGWDPITGLGTPNFAKLKAMFLQLP